MVLARSLEDLQRHQFHEKNRKMLGSEAPILRQVYVTQSVGLAIEHQPLYTRRLYSVVLSVTLQKKCIYRCPVDYQSWYLFCAYVYKSNVALLTFEMQTFKIKI